ncbi:MAG: hypothetical protein ACRD2W_09075, partial [Acidimicrobiales bacterium]
APSTTTVAATTTTVADPTCPGVPARAQPAEDRPRYVVRADIRPAESLATGDLQVRFTPDLATDRLVFRLWPNGPRPAPAGVRLDVADVTVGGRPVEASQEDPTTLVALTGALAAGRPVEAALSWRLQVEGTVSDRVSRTGDSLRLGSFLPMLAWEPGRGWATEPPSPVGETSTFPAADFDLTVTVPDGLNVLATGVEDRPGHWTATAVRDVGLSVGRFTFARGRANAPGPVDVTVGVDPNVADRPQNYLDQVIAALEAFAARYGPYPWPSFTLALTPGLMGGIEYPGHVMQGAMTTGVTTIHEVAHQWFYALVGNNQAVDPWLDEAVATYVEARHSGRLPALRSLPVPAQFQGRAGEPMTAWTVGAPYSIAVYLQGGQAIASLGEAGPVDCALRFYVARHAYGIARPGDFIDAVSTVLPGAEATLAGVGIRR